MMTRLLLSAALAATLMAGGPVYAQSSSPNSCDSLQVRNPQAHQQLCTGERETTEYSPPVMGDDCGEDVVPVRLRLEMKAGDRLHTAGVVSGCGSVG